MQGEFPVSNAGLAQAFDFIARAIRDDGRDEGHVHRLSVILDELCANMIRHDDTLGDTTSFTLILAFDGPGTTMTIRDPGRPFDPLQFRHEEQPEIGGHGISLVKGLSSKIAYRRDGDWNELTLTVTGDD